MAWHWTLLRAGRFRLDGGSMFGVVPRVLWSRAVEPDGKHRIPIQSNCLLLENGSRTVVIETGFGDKWTDKERSIFDLEHRTIADAVREAGHEPEAIDDVIVTHLHFDHAGGLTLAGDDGAPVPTFPNARIHVQEREWEDALANRSTMTRTYLRSHLDPVAERVEFLDGEKEVCEGLVAWPMPGHTWGHQAIRFQDDKGTVCFPGDVIPTIHHVDPAWNMAYDMLPFTNMESKRALLERAAAEGWRLVLAHEPGAPVVAPVLDESGSAHLATMRGDPA